MAEGSGATRLWWALAVAATGAKLWLTAGQGVFVIGHAAHDDRLFVQLAAHLTDGRWLGPYDQMTLAKGPFYSLWMAAMLQLGVPLFLSQQALYAAACAVFVRAWWPGLRSAAIAVAVYLLLLWNPMTFDGSSLGRVLRQHVYSPLLLLTLAAVVALHFRRDVPFRRAAGWSVLGGAALAAFWLTREEGIWILPTLGLLAGAWLLGAARRSGAALVGALRHGALAAVAFAAPLLAVSALNHRHYGWFGTVEFRAAAFADAYGALLRVRAGPDLPQVPVTRAAREAAYAASPAFARLRPHFEGPVGEGWAAASTGVTGLPPERREVGGGWMVWALRDAVAAAGLAPDAGAAMAFYRTMADEINAACDAGRLDARGGRDSGFQPPPTAEQLRLIPGRFLEFADFVVRFSRFSARTPASVGDEDSLRLFADITGSRPNAPTPDLSRQAARDARRVEWLHAIGKALRLPLFGLFLLAQAVLVARVVELAVRRTWTYGATLAVACWGGGAVYVLLTAVMDVTSYPILAISSFAPAYTMVLLFTATALHEAGTAWLRPSAARA